jgi:predicted ribosomally synthesized peptide with nif11-like leader
VVNAIAHIHIKPPRLAEERFVAGGAAAMPVAGGVVLGIRLRFHNHTPQQLTIRLAFHQQAWLLRWAQTSILLTPGWSWAILGLTTPRPLQAMSEEQLKAFWEAVQADEGLQEKLKAAGDADAVIAIAKAAGFAISAEELQRAQAELSDEELSGVVAGGLLTSSCCCGYFPRVSLIAE